MKILYISFFVLLFDSIYLNSLHSYFKKVFKAIQGSELTIDYVGAILSYLFIIISIYYFGFIKKGKPIDLFLLGLFIYGIYEFTNYATFKKWPIFMIITDTIWGGILYLLTFITVKKITG